LHAARNLLSAGVLHDRDFRSSVILSRQNLDAFVIALTFCHARPGAIGEVYLRAMRSLLVALAVRSLSFCLQRSLCAAVAAAGASAEVETNEMTK